MWVCPNCKKTFREKNISHSCAIVDVEEHFKNRSPILKEVYDKIISTINGFGPFKINPVKASVNIKILSTYLEFKVKKDHLFLAFYLDRTVNEFPVHRIVPLSKTRIVHCINLDHPEQVDKKLISLLKESYVLISK